MDIIGVIIPFFFILFSLNTIRSIVLNSQDFNIFAVPTSEFGTLFTFFVRYLLPLSVTVLK